MLHARRQANEKAVDGIVIQSPAGHLPDGTFCPRTAEVALRSIGNRSQRVLLHHHETY
jgi:hypothetical protein